MKDLRQTDSSGDTYAFWGPDRRVLYLNIDARTGVVGRDLAEAIQVITHLPHWHDLLGFSGNGSLHEMHRSDPVLLERFQKDTPNILELGKEVRTRLHLEDLADPVLTLHTTVSTLSPKRVVNLRYGGFNDPLFGPITIDGLQRRRARNELRE